MVDEHGSQHIIIFPTVGELNEKKTRWWGKNQDFMLIRFFNTNDLIDCGGDN